MKFTRALSGTAALAIAAAFGIGPVPAQSSVTPVQGAYTAKQAAAGAKLYAENCSGCHGATLRGTVAPALVGDAWTSQFTNEPVSDMYGLMSKNMPLGAPGTLKPAEYLAITAYILQQNKYKAGTMPLTTAKLKTIKIVSPPNS
jgi:mono/diheme cytochrome c family protein